MVWKGIFKSKSSVLCVCVCFFSASLTFFEVVFECVGYIWTSFTHMHQADFKFALKAVGCNCVLIFLCFFFRSLEQWSTTHHNTAQPHFWVSKRQKDRYWFCMIKKTRHLWPGFIFVSGTASHVTMVVETWPYCSICSQVSPVLFALLAWSGLPVVEYAIGYGQVG